MSVEVLDLFSAAAGGWSLGLHRAGYTTIAACEVEAWRRAIYAENNPHVRLYDDVRTLTADRLRADLGRLPTFVVGSPPCQDISSANTKGRGVEGERSGLYFEAVRIIGECRPRWFALENSANLRTRGADAVIAALEAIGYTCWPCVVRAGDIGANHERPRAWLIGCDLEQVGDAHVQCGPSRFRAATFEGSDAFEPRRFRPDAEHGRGGALHVEHSSSIGHEGWRARGHGSDGNGPAYPVGPEVDLCAPDSLAAFRGRADWSLADLADHLRLDDGLSARLAGTRVAVGDGKGQSAASLVVEAFGDAVIPQIPEAIGRAIQRVERAMAAIHERIAA